MKLTTKSDCLKEDVLNNSLFLILVSPNSSVYLHIYHMPLITTKYHLIL